MAELSEVINVPPKRRITIPEGSVAIIVSKAVADDIKTMCLFIRKGRKLDATEKFQIHEIAGDLLLALVEAEQ